MFFFFELGSFVCVVGVWFSLFFSVFFVEIQVFLLRFARRIFSIFRGVLGLFVVWWVLSGFVVVVLIFCFLLCFFLVVFCVFCCFFALFALGAAWVFFFFFLWCCGGTCLLSFTGAVSIARCLWCGGFCFCFLFVLGERSVGGGGWLWCWCAVFLVFCGGMLVLDFFSLACWECSFLGRGGWVACFGFVCYLVIVCWGSFGDVVVVCWGGLLVLGRGWFCVFRVVCVYGVFGCVVGFVRVFWFLGVVLVLGGGFVFWFWFVLWCVLLVGGALLCLWFLECFCVLLFFLFLVRVLLVWVLFFWVSGLLLVLVFVLGCALRVFNWCRVMWWVLLFCAVYGSVCSGFCYFDGVFFVLGCFCWVLCFCLRGEIFGWGGCFGVLCLFLCG